MTPIDADVPVASPEWLDDEGYPTEEALQKIRDWPPPQDWRNNDHWRAIFEFVKALWWAPDWGWHEDVRGQHAYVISTAGWSGNESLITAMLANQTLRMMCWQQSRRGGHYVFTLPEERKEAKEENHASDRPGPEAA